MFSWEAFMDIWAKQALVVSTLVVFTVGGYITGKLIEKAKAKRYFNLYHDKISKDNVERWKADKQKALDREAKALKLYDELDARYRAAKIMAQKIVEMLS